MIGLICALLASAPTPVAAATEAKTTEKQSWIDGKAAIVMDAKLGRIVYAKNIDKRCYPASITKILTTLVAIENNDDLDELVTFSDAAVNHLEEGSTHIGIKVGEKIRLRDVLSAIMLESANEACNGAAEHTAGSIDKFVDLMNKKAQELGCTNSHFVTTNGLHDDKHYVTARDMAIISKAALENETFREIANTSNSYIPPTNKDKKGKELWNHHKMVKKTMFSYDGVEGGKTGYTTKAGGTLVTFVKRGEQEYIVVILRGNGYELYRDTTKLMDYAYKNYQTVTPYAGVDSTLHITDNYDILKTGNQLSPCTLSVDKLKHFSVCLRKDEDPSKLSYQWKGNKWYVSYGKESLGYLTF